MAPGVRFIGSLVAVGRSVRVAMCCSVLQCVVVCCSVLQCVAMRCSVQCVAVCCSVLHAEVVLLVHTI